MILVQCASYSKKFCYEFSKVGGLRYLMLLIHKASDEELNEVCKYMLPYFLFGTNLYMLEFLLIFKDKICVMTFAEMTK